jgi:uncharacterized membrane protein
MKVKNPVNKIVVENDSPSCRNGKRACCKLAFIICVTLTVLIGLYFFVDSQVVSGIKENFSLGVIIALVVIVNLVSFLCFIVLYAAYQWVRCDLKEKRLEDIVD